jgi:hypothetical protein
MICSRPKGHQPGQNLLPPQRHQAVGFAGQDQGRRLDLAQGLLLVGSALQGAGLADVGLEPQPAAMSCTSASTSSRQSVSARARRGIRRPPPRPAGRRGRRRAAPRVSRPVAGGSDSGSVEIRAIRRHRLGQPGAGCPAPRRRQGHGPAARSGAAGRGWRSGSSVRRSRRQAGSTTCRSVPRSTTCGRKPRASIRKPGRMTSGSVIASARSSTSATVAAISARRPASKSGGRHP